MLNSLMLMFTPRVCPAWDLHPELTGLSRAALLVSLAGLGFNSDQVRRTVAYATIRPLHQEPPDEIVRSDLSTKVRGDSDYRAAGPRLFTVESDRDGTRPQRINRNTDERDHFGPAGICTRNSRS